MTLTCTVPEEFKIVDMTAGAVTTNGGVTSDYVNVGYAHKVTLILQFTQAAAHATVITLRQASDASGTGVKAISDVAEIWANEDTATSDTLVHQTAAKTYTLTADIKKKLVVIEFPPAAFDTNNDFQYFNFTLSDSSEATNFVAGHVLLHSRYPQASVPGGPTAIT